MIVKNAQEVGLIVKQGQFINKIYRNAKLVYELDYVTDGLVQHYDAINNTGSGHDPLAVVWKDLVGNNDGTLQLGGDWINGNTLRFNGNNRVRFDGKITDDYTIMATMSIVKSGTHPRLFGDPRYPTVYFHTNAGAGNEYAFAFYSTAYGGTASFDDVFNTRSTAVIPEANTSYHVAIRSTGSDGSAKVELFVNGIKVGETTRGVPAVLNTTNAYLGGNNATNRFLTGTISNFMRYDRVLSDDEVYNNAIIDLNRF
jgi:hypothetical protein